MLPGTPPLPQPAADHDQGREHSPGQYVDDVVLAVVDERRAHGQGIEDEQPPQRSTQPPDAVDGDQERIAGVEGGNRGHGVAAALEDQVEAAQAEVAPASAGEPWDGLADVAVL